MKMKRSMSSLVLLTYLLLLVPDSMPNLILTSEPQPPSMVAYCLGQVVFTCTATDISVLFHWELNDDMIGPPYSFNSMDRYPLNVAVTSPLIDSIQVINATVNGNSLNIISTLSVSNILTLNGSSLHCEDSLGRKSNATDIVVVSRGPPPVPAPNCSLFPSSGGLEIQLQWSAMFNHDHVVDKYRVSMSPSLPSCPNILKVGPDQDYTCSVLEIGQQYSTSFVAFNCMDQEGETGTYSYQVQVPSPPIQVSLINDQIIEWVEAAIPSFSVDCTVDSTVSYLVIVQDNSGEMIVNKTVLSDSCENGVCSTTIPFSDSNCRVTVRASNVFGESENGDFAIIEPVNYTSTNIGLMVAGLILWVLSLIIFCIGPFLIKGSKVFINKSVLYFFSVCIGILLVVVPLSLWVAAGVYVILQEDTCDPSWQSARDKLIISAHVISDIALIISILFISFIGALFYLKKSNSLDIKPLEPHSVPEKPIELDEHVYATTQHNNAQPAVQHSIAEPAQDQNYNKLDSKPAPNANKYHTLDHGPGTLKDEREPKRPPPLPGYAAFGEVRSDDEFCKTGEDAKAATHRVEEAKYQEHVECPCHSMEILNEHLQKNTLNPPSEQVAAWMMKYRKWPEEDLNEGKPLKVYFMNRCPVEWKYMGRSIDAGFIMEILQSSWRGCFINCTSKNDASIRVKFKGSNSSSLGSLAKAVPTSEPTMVLDFTAFDDATIKATVIHQFGHALGLGHVLMDPGDWAILKNYVDMEKMMKDLGVRSEKDIEVQWTGKGLSQVNRDSSSVMQYCTSLSWIKDEKFCDPLSLDVPSKHKKVLQKLSKHAKIYQQKLSDGDKQTLDMLLGRSKEQSRFQGETRELTLNDLTCLKSGDGSEIFNLTEVVLTYWESIGMELGASPEMLEKLKVKNETDYKRMVIIWKMWLDHEIDKYRPTDVGLIDLLKNEKLFGKNFALTIALNYTHFKSQ